MKRILAIGVLAALGASVTAMLAAPLAFAEGMRVGPIAHEAAMAECSACHMAYPAGLLPQASWKAIMSDLSDHFGEDASLDAATTAEIEAYLVANASDAANPRVPQPGDITFLRISDQPWFQREHRNARKRAEADPKIGSISNCVACHAGAQQGIFEDD